MERPKYCKACNGVLKNINVWKGVALCDTCYDEWIGDIKKNEHINNKEPYNTEKLDQHLQEVRSEVLRAKTLFPDRFVNQHEAYAVILEEIDELWDEIKKNQKNYDLPAQKKEATQAAAMLLRLLTELL